MRPCVLKKTEKEEIIYVVAYLKQIFLTYRLTIQNTGTHKYSSILFVIFKFTNNYSFAVCPFQIMENAEINNIIKIVGLQYKKNYEDEDSLKTLRYGKIMIMTDQVRFVIKYFRLLN